VKWTFATDSKVMRCAREKTRLAFGTFAAKDAATSLYVNLKVEIEALKAIY